MRCSRRERAAYRDGKRADDSGIAIDASTACRRIVGALGGSRKSDAANLQLVLEQLPTRLMSDAASIRCVAALVTPSAWMAVGRGDRVEADAGTGGPRTPRQQRIRLRPISSRTEGRHERGTPRREGCDQPSRQGRCVGWLPILQRRSGDRSDRVIVSADRPIGDRFGSRSFVLSGCRACAYRPAGLPSFLPSSLLLPPSFRDGAPIFSL